MLLVGPDLFAGKSPVTTLVFGRSPLNLGPMAGGWVLLGHESLTATYVVPALGELAYLSASLGTEGHPVLSAVGGAVGYIVAAREPEVYTISMDDVATKHTKVNGAEVKQWQQ